MAVVIVSGLPRSGTSLMMQMLQAGGMPLLADGVRQADEDNPHGYFEYEPVKRLQADASWLDAAEGKAVRVIYSLLPRLPSDRAYKVILMTRPMAEVLASQRAMLGRRGTEGSTLSDAALGAVFEQQLGRIESWLATRPGFDVLRVSYPDAIQSPQVTAEKVAAFLGNGLAVEEMVKVVDPALYRQRK